MEARDVLNKYFDTFGINVIPNTGGSIMGTPADEDMVVDTSNICFELIYLDGNWRLA